MARYVVDPDHLKVVGALIGPAPISAVVQDASARQRFFVV
jgi:hypothetical protein